MKLPLVTVTDEEYASELDIDVIVSGQVKEPEFIVVPLQYMK